MLICYERKVLLTDWWLVVGADLMWEKNTAGWLADKPNEQSVDWEWPNCWPCSIDRSLQYDVHKLLFPRHRQLTYLHMIETLFYMNVLHWTRMKFGIISMSSFCVRHGRLSCTSLFKFGYLLNGKNWRADEDQGQGPLWRSKYIAERSMQAIEWETVMTNCVENKVPSLRWRIKIITVHRINLQLSTHAY